MAARRRGAGSCRARARRGWPSARTPTRSGSRPSCRSRAGRRVVAAVAAAAAAAAAGAGHHLRRLAEGYSHQAQRVHGARPAPHWPWLRRRGGGGCSRGRWLHTEASSSSSASASALPPQFQLPQEFMLSPTAALSPAARYAAIERSVRPLPPTTAHYYTADADDPILLDVDGDAAAFAAALGPARPSILSPVPSALRRGVVEALLPARPGLRLLAQRPQPLRPLRRRRRRTPPPFAPSPRSLLLSTPTMPSPATFSVMEFFSSNFPDL